MSLHKFVRAFERSVGTRPLSLATFATLLLILTVAASPFPYGSILPGGTLRIELFAFVALAAALGSTSRATRRLESVRPLIFFTAALALLAVVQVLPLGPALVGLLSPSSARIFAEGNSILQSFGDTRRVAPRISIAPQETVAALLQLLAYAALVCSAVVLLNTRFLRRAVVAALLLGAVVQVVVGVVSAEQFGERIHGNFVNANHLAAFLEIALAVSFAIIWLVVVRGAERARRTNNRSDQFERRVLPVIPPLLLWGFLAGGIALTRSRGGFLAATATTLVMLLITFTWTRRERGIVTGLVLMGGVIGGIAFVAMSTGNAAISRLLASDPSDLGADTRLQLWRYSVEAWKQFPIFGSGIGAFRDAFRRVQPRDLSGLVEYAHNDALQMLVGGGVIGLVITAAAFLWMLRRLVRVWGEGRRREESAMILATIGSLLTIVLHGVVEFNLSIPAIPATLAVVCGCGLAAARRRERSEAEGNPPESGAREVFMEDEQEAADATATPGEELVEEPVAQPVEQPVAEAVAEPVPEHAPDGVTTDENETAASSESSDEVVRGEEPAPPTMEESAHDEQTPTTAGETPTVEYEATEAIDEDEGETAPAAEAKKTAQRKRNRSKRKKPRK